LRRQDNQCIQTLDLSDNMIQDAGALALASSFRVNTMLTSINLSANGIHTEGDPRLLTRGCAAFHGSKARISVIRSL
jgi:hypothetical protein